MSVSADEDRFYTIVFQRGPLGIGIDPPSEDHDEGSVVTAINPKGQQSKNPNLRVGDAVVSINGLDITGFNHVDTAAGIKAAKRPMTIVFERAPYHPRDQSLEEPLKKTWKDCEVNGTRNLKTGPFLKALEDVGVPAAQSNIGEIIQHLSEMLKDDEEYSYEDFLHEIYQFITKEHPIFNSSRQSSRPSSMGSRASLAIDTPGTVVDADGQPPRRQKKKNRRSDGPVDDVLQLRNGKKKATKSVLKKAKVPYYVYTKEEIAARKPPLYKPFQLQEAYAMSSWASRSNNMNEKTIKKKIKKLFKQFCHHDKITVPTMVERKLGDGTSEWVPHKWITEEKEMTTLNKGELARAFEAVGVVLPPRVVEKAYSKEPSEEELAAMDPKMAQAAKDEIAWDKLYEDDFVSIMLPRYQKPLLIQRMFRAYALRQRCFHRKCGRTGKAKVKKAYRAIRFKQRVEANDQSVEQFEVVYHTAALGLGLEPPPYWESGNVVTLIVPGGESYNQGKVKVGDYLIAVGDVDVTRMNHEDSLNVLKAAKRPLKLVFRRFFNRAEREKRNKEREQKRLDAAALLKKKTTRSVEAQKLAEQQIAEEEAKIRLAKENAAENKANRARLRRQKRQEMRDKVARRVLELEGKVSVRPKTHAVRCPICTLAIPCSHFASATELAKNTSAKDKRSLPPSTSSSMELNPSISRPLTSSFNAELGVDMAPIEFGETGVSDIDKNDAIEEQDLLNEDMLRDDEDLQAIVLENKLPLKFRVTMSRLEKHSFAAGAITEHKNAKRGLLVTPPVRALFRAGRKSSPRERKIVEQSRRERLLRQKMRQGHEKEPTPPLVPQQILHHRKDATPNGSLFHLCLIPPTRDGDGLSTGIPAPSNQSSRTPTPVSDVMEDVIFEKPKPKKKLTGTDHRNERMKRLDFMLEQRRWAEEQVLAAERIQASFRGYKIRKQPLEDIILERDIQDRIDADIAAELQFERDQASIKIQAMYRRRMAEVAVEDRKKEMAMDAERAAAAAKIQALARGRAARQNGEGTTEDKRNKFRESLAIRGIFQHLDANHDGYISNEELKAGIYEFILKNLQRNTDPAMDTPPIELGTEEDIQNLEFEIARKDHKNYGVATPRITLKAFVAYIHEMVSPDHSDLPSSTVRPMLSHFLRIVKARINEAVVDQNKLVLGSMFTKFDVDDSGTIDLVELRKMMRFFSKDDSTPTVLETKELMNMLDTDKTYRLERQEWITLMLTLMQKSYLEKQQIAEESEIARKLISFAFQVEKGVHRFLVNVHELWCMYDKAHAGFLPPSQVATMLLRAYISIFILTKQPGPRPKTPNNPPPLDVVRMFINIINTHSDAKHHAHDMDADRVLTEDSFTGFLLQGLVDLGGVRRTFSKNEKQVKAIYEWRFRMVKMLMWSEGE